MNWVSLAFAVAISFLGARDVGAEALRLHPGSAEVLRTDGKTATIILGDPELADVTLVNERTIALRRERRKLRASLVN